MKHWMTNHKTYIANWPCKREWKCILGNFETYLIKLSNFLEGNNTNTKAYTHYLSRVYKPYKIIYVIIEEHDIRTQGMTKWWNCIKRNNDCNTYDECLYKT